MADYATTPRRLLTDERLLTLPGETILVLLRAYVACDRYGGLPADEMAARVRLGVVDGTSVRPHLDALEAAGLLQVHTVGGRRFAHLEAYDADLTKEMRRKRGAPEYPLPPGWAPFSEDGQDDEGTPEAPQVQSKGAPGPEQGRPKGALRAPQVQSKGAAPCSRVSQAEPSQAEQSPGGGASAPAPRPRGAPPSARGLEWPSDEHRVSAEAWLAELAARGGRGKATLAQLASLATGDGGEWLPPAVTRMLAGAKGWKSQDPLGWLRRELRIVAEDAADADRRRRGSRPPPAPRPEAEPWVAEVEACTELLSLALASTGAQRRQRASAAAAILDGLEAPPGVLVELTAAVRAAALDPPTATQVAQWEEFVAGLDVEARDREEWLDPLRLVAVAGDEVYIAAPDTTHAEWVAQHWLPRARWVTGVEVRA